MSRILSLMLSLLLVVAATYAADGQTTSTYSGTLSDITMNDKTFHDLSGKVFTLTLSSPTSGTIDGEVGKIGRMPGTLHFTLPVTIDADGTLHATRGDEAGRMTMNIGLSRKLVTESFSGWTGDQKLHFTLRITSSMLGITMADATLTFDGQLQQ